jgi:hypothetical protein
VNNYLKLHVRILDTPAGKIAKNIVNSIGDNSLSIGLRGAGEIQKDGTVENVKIFAWDLISKPKQR